MRNTTGRWIFGALALALILLAILLWYEKSEKAATQQPSAPVSEPISLPAKPTQEPVSLPEIRPSNTEASLAPIRLSFPLDCTLGETCWIARYSNRGGNNIKSDYQCRTRTQIGHKGTDFAVADLGMMQSGVSVLAAADGTIKGVRSDEPDISVKSRGIETIKGKECGNGLVIAHSNGWTSQYCHLKKNSLPVKAGDAVTAGQVIGQIGLSGQTEYPHLHFTLRNNGGVIDPFDGQTMSKACNPKKADPLWADPIAYAPFALVSATFSAASPTNENRWDTPPKTLANNSPALMLTGRVFGSLKGDKWQITIKRPNGSVFSNQEIFIQRNRQFWLQYSGRKKPKTGFEPGIWTGEITVTRTNSDGILQTQKSTTSVKIE